MKINSITEAGVDKAVGTAKDVASAASLSALASQLPKVPGAIKAVGKRALPGANMAYQGLDSAKRATAGDSVGSAIAAASMHPYLAIPGAIVQAGRDKVRTGSFLPSDEEVAAAAKKDKEAGGYWKSRGSDYDPSYMPESKSMKSNRLHTAIIKEELELKKCSMTESEIQNTLFIYKDSRGNLFTESGKHIDTKRLDEAPAWLKTGLDAAKTGWNAVKTYVPPAYRATKAGIGKAADELGNIYQAGKKAATAVGNELVDIPTSAAKKIRGAYQDVRYGTTPDMDPAQRLAHIDDYKTRTNLQDLGQAEIQGTKADIANRTRQAKADAAATTRQSKADAAATVRQSKADVDRTRAAADVERATARDIEAKRPIDWKSLGKQTAAGTAIAGAGTDVLQGTDVEINPVTGKPSFDYSPGRGIKRTVGIDEATLWDYLFGKGDTDKPKPAPEPAKPEPPKPAPEPAKPEPPKPAPEPSKPAKPEPAKPEPAKPEPAKPEPAKPEPAKPEPAKPEPANTGSDKVRAMQQKLKAAGYGSMLGTFGPEGDGVDGKWGKRTQAAYDAYMADKQAKKQQSKNVDPSVDPYDPKKDTTIQYTELPGSSSILKPTVPVKAYLDQEPDLSKFRDNTTLSKQRVEPIDWKSRNPNIKGVFESDLQTILKLAGRQ